jgi:very-short-patch-repair endonuclease
MDFYCPSERLCVELDGATHDADDERAHDEKRSEFLSSHSIKVLRLRNEEVYKSVEKVLEKISEEWRR